MSNVEQASETEVMRDVFVLCLRSMDETKRKATYIAATETGVMGWNGKEYLRIDGMDLTRYAKNPVVLDSHDRYTIDSIIGRADMRKEGRKLVAEVTFANSPKGDLAWNLTKQGMLNAGSVGFIPDKSSVRDLTDSQVDGEGEFAIKGPGRVLTKSQLFEFSLCPVPADPDALRRSFLGGFEMSKENEKPATGNPAPAVKEGEKPAPVALATQTPAAVVTPSVVDESVRIRNLAGDDESLQAIAQRCILEGKSVEESRKEMLADYTKRSAPVGTPEAPAAPAKGGKDGDKGKGAEVTNDVLLRTLTGNLSNY